MSMRAAVGASEILQIRRKTMSGDQFMRRPFVKYIGIMGIIIGLALMIGCGDSDVLDESATRYNATATPWWNDDSSNSVDVVFVLCDAADPASGEPLLPFGAKIVVESDATGQPFTIYGYEVRFRNNHGTYYEEGLGWDDLSAAEMPTLTGQLNNMTYSHSSPVIEANGTYTVEGLPIWSGGDITYYLNAFLAAQSFLDEEALTLVPAGDWYEYHTTSFTYDMQITLKCRTSAEDQEFEIETPWTPVNFTNVNNCGSAE
jgi:hypothetical protein